MTASNFRIGQGYDIHALVEGRPLILGGVTIAHSHGLLGHSDADALIHAIIDALLGAAGLGDIGRHFPDTDDRYKDVDSRVLLKATLGLLKAADYQISNIDATVICQRPKLAEYIPQMVSFIAHDLGLTPSHVNVKAKTNEKLGYLGREEGIAVHAVALLYKD